jgi:poly(3-hydroxybutyrate) depolymerase
MTSRLKLGALTAIMCAVSFPSLAQAPQPDPAAPQYRAKGEQDRSYLFPGTDERIPYRLYVPTTWTPASRLPLIVVTHGANQPATAPFQRPTANPTLAQTAEARGFIIAAVTGYHANATAVGGWNVPYKMVPAPSTNAAAPGGGGRRGGGAPPAAPTDEDFRRAEMDVLFVADLVAREYNTDPARIYLMGNSAGGSAVWTYATRYPERWTAIAPSAAPLEDAAFPYDKLRQVPTLIVHGDADTTMSFAASQAMYEHAKARGVTVEWLPVAGGAHTDAWAQPQVITRIFDFFDAHKTKQARSAP